MESVPSLSKTLIEWYDRHRRDLPWRNTTDPYRIWVAEVMLQQTRVAAVIPYYRRFIEKFPAVEVLAAASEVELLSAWSGLGYYSRARGLLAAAREVASAGRFPASFEALLTLPGIGEYTAAAIASIALGLPHAVLDGNVARVMARLTGEDGDIRSATVRRRLREAAQHRLDRRRPGDFNQAVMELGATLCLPRDPRCRVCPIREQCAAYGSGRQGELPVKSARPAVERIARTVYVIRRRQRLLLWPRPGDSARLAGFWELPEAAQAPSAHRREKLGSFRHTIVNQNYRFEVWRADVGKAPQGCRWVPLAAVNALPLSTTARKALRLPAAPGGT